MTAHVVQDHVFHGVFFSSDQVHAKAPPPPVLYIKQAQFSHNQSQSVLNKEPEGYTLRAVFTAKHKHTHDSMLYFTRTGMKRRRQCFKLQSKHISQIIHTNALMGLIW